MNRKKGNALFRFFRESQESWPGWILLLCISFLSGWFSTSIAELTGSLIDIGIEGEYGRMKGVGIALAAVLLGNCVRTFLNYYVNARTSETMFSKLRRRMFRALTCGKLSYIEGRFQTGDMVSRLNSDIGSLCDIVAGRFVWYLRVLAEAAVTLVVCIRISWELSMVYLVILPLTFFIMLRLTKAMQEQQKKVSVNTGDAASLVSEAVSNIATVKTFHIEDKILSKFTQTVDTAKEQEKKMTKTESWTVGVRYATQIVQMAGLFAVAFFYVSQGSLSAGSAVAFITICTNIKTALELSDGMIVYYHRAVALSERIYEVLDTPEMEKGGLPVDLSAEEAVSFENVTFSYVDSCTAPCEDSHRDEKTVLNGISLHVPKGRRIGVVGPSGCGKSTLIKLICKFYGISGGKLLLYGEDIDSLSEETVYQQLSLVGQEPYLFSGTVLDNIRNGRPDTSVEEAEEVLKRVQLWDFVSSLEKGIHTEIGEGGGKMSGGQAQRLSIARAMIKNARLVLLDEPTSALDVKTEHELKDAFEELLRGKTAVIVTHRYAVIENADYVYCLDPDGKVAEEGTPEELMRRKGYYYSMYLAQQNG